MAQHWRRLRGRILVPSAAGVFTPGSGLYGQRAASGGGGGVDGELTTWAGIASAAAANTSTPKTFYVRAGNYTATTLSGITRTAPVKFLGYPGEEASININGTGLDLSGCSRITFEGMKTPGGVNVANSNNIILDRFKVVNAGARIDNLCNTILFDRFYVDAGGIAGQCVILDGGSGPSNTTVADGVTLRRGIIKQPIQDGFRIQQGKNLLIDTCEITLVCDNVFGTDTHSDSISVTGSLGVCQNITVQYCYFHDNDGQGFYCDDNPTSNITADNNLFVRQAGAGLGVGNGNEIVMMAVNGLTVTNNTCWTDGSIGFAPRQNDPTGANSNITWHHNVVRNPYDDGGSPSLASATLARHHNLISNDGFAGSITANTGGGTNEASASPATVEASFNNMATDDFRTSITAGGQAVGITVNVAALSRGPGF